MLLKKSKKTTKRGSESRRIREQGESTFENIDERDEDYLYNDSKKKQISSEENNISSSVDIDKLKNTKKGKKGKKTKRDKQQQEIDNALIQMEKNNKEKMLNGELAELMEEIELENKDFKKNVFFSNFHELNNNLGIFDEIGDKNMNKKNDNYEGIKGNEINSYGLINKYTEKAQNIKKKK